MAIVPVWPESDRGPGVNEEAMAPRDLLEWLCEPPPSISHALHNATGCRMFFLERQGQVAPARVVEAPQEVKHAAANLQAERAATDLQVSRLRAFSGILDGAAKFTVRNKISIRRARRRCSKSLVEIFLERRVEHERRLQ
eukprot:8651427-Pyramimonas_sp.AAC.1